MSRRASVRITPLYPDGTACAHRFAPGGKVADPQCDGRANYRAACQVPDCGWEYAYPIRAVVDEEVGLHRASHGPLTGRSA